MAFYDDIVKLVEDHVVIKFTPKGWGIAHMLKSGCGNENGYTVAYLTQREINTLDSNAAHELLTTRATNKLCELEEYRLMVNKHKEIQL